MKNTFRFAALAACAAVLLAACLPKEEIDTSVKLVGLDKVELTLGIGQSETLTATIEPATAENLGVSWRSSDPSVAFVENGVVTGVSEGSALVTVTTEEGGFKAACNVTVKDKGPWGHIPQNSFTVMGYEEAILKSVGVYYSEEDEAFDIVFLSVNRDSFGSIDKEPLCSYLVVDLAEEFLGEQSLTDELYSYEHNWEFYLVSRSIFFEGGVNFSNGKVKLNIDKDNQTIDFAIDGVTLDGKVVQGRYYGPYVPSDDYIFDW